MRLAGEVAGTKNAVIEIVKLCYEARAWKTLNDQIVLLSKRRGQLKQVKSFTAISLSKLPCCTFCDLDFVYDCN